MDNALLLNEHVAILLLSEGGAWVASLIAMIVAFRVLSGWDPDAYDALQYRRERHTWLVATLLIFVATVKLLTLPFFVFTLDRLSSVVPGAMCAAGVISFTSHGMGLLYLKIVLMGLMGFWMVLYRDELHRGDWRHVRVRMVYAGVLSLLYGVALVWEWRFFAAIDIHKVLNCCTTLYGLLEGMNPLPWGLDPVRLGTLFFLLYGLILTAWIGRERWLLGGGVILFFIVGYYAVLYIFGPYIYEQPNHNCPFCMMKREYHYVGYLVWGALLGGVFAGVWALLSEVVLHRRQPGLLRIMAGLLSLFVLLNVGYVGGYYLRHKTLLSVPEGGMSGMMMDM